ncbi:hypothetical protein ACFDTO_35420 [Microbacteriaceae bacterium 4G12]
MRRKICLMFSIICFIISLSTNEIASANRNNRPLTPKECYIKMGFKSVEEAVKDFENHYREDVKLPTKKPPIPFTLQVGKFYKDKAYNTNDHLRLEFLDEKSLGNYYEIVIRPLKNKLVFKPRENQKVYNLQNAQKAIYMVDRYHNFFVFEKDNWQYMLGVDRRVENKVTPEVLVGIANSIPE